MIFTRASSYLPSERLRRAPALRRSATSIRVVSSHAREGELAAPAGEEDVAQAEVGGVAKVGVGGDDGLGLAACLLEQGPVADEVGEPELRQTRLPRAEELAGAAQLEVDLRDLEPIGARHHGVDAPLGVLTEGRRGEEDAVGLPR